MALHRANTQNRKLTVALGAIFALFASPFTASQPSFAAADVSMYISAPFVQGSHVSGAGVRSENFNGLSNCTSTSGVGTMSRVQTDARAFCAIQNGDTYGGAAVDALVSTPTTSGASSKYITNGYDEVTYDLDAPAKYVGLWWSAGNDSNTVTFYDAGNQQIAQLTAVALKNLLGGTVGGASGNLTTVDGSTHPKANYWGNPMNRAGASDEPYAYLNLFISGGVAATKIVISGGGFEHDNLVTSEADETPTSSMVYVSSSSGTQTLAQAIAWAPTNTTGDVSAGSITPNSLASVTTPATGGGAITYSVANAGTSGCTVNSSTGVISYTAAGTCAVRSTAAAVAGTQNYFAATKDVTFTFSATPPNTPGTPTAVAGNASATVTVVAPSTGPSPTSYTVTAAPGGATCTVTAPATSCVMSGLTNGTAYTFTSTATNANGTSSASAASAAVTPTAPTPPPAVNYEPYIPPAPTTITAVELTKGTDAAKSKIKVLIKEPSNNSLTTDVKVKLVDFSGKLIKELVIPVENSTQTVELAVDLPYGDFKVEAVATNQYLTSQPVYSTGALVNKQCFETNANSKLPILAGTTVGKTVYFAPNSAKLTEAAKKNLTALSETLKASESRIALTGFSAKWTKSAKFEQSLATKRAFAVGSYLKSLGVANWVYYSGYGSLTGVEKLVSARKVEIRVVD